MTDDTSGPAVGVADPYAHVDRCDFLTDDGRCRFALERRTDDPTFAAARRAEDYQCPVVDPDRWEWQDCPNFRATAPARECARCGLRARPDRIAGAHPLIEEHHLSYPEDGNEITVGLCRWCHARIHRSGARIDDDVEPPADAVAAREARLEREREESTFESAADRYDPDSS